MPGSHFEYAGAHLRLTEAKSETTEKKAKMGELGAVLRKMCLMCAICVQNHNPISYSHPSGHFDHL